MGEKLERGEVYRGPAGVLKDSNWLTAETLPPDKDTVVTIEAVIRRGEVKFQSETKKGYGSLRFVGKDKELGLNATNIKVLCALFGKNTGDWFGKRISLYVDPEVNAFGKMVAAIRIRARKLDQSQPKGAAAPQDEPSEGGLEAPSDVGVTAEPRAE